MIKQDLQAAINEAARFLNKANAAIVEMNAGRIQPYTPNKEASAVKRASMDLTRSLAELRRRGK